METMTKRRCFFLLSGIFLVVAVICITVRPVRHALFPWTVNRILEVTILTYPPWGFSMTGVEPGTQVVVEADHGRRLQADLFRTSGPLKGRILFVHGSIPKGRKFSPYRFIAGELSKLGFDVLLPDIGGYGDSPLEPGSVPTFGADVAASARALDGLTENLDSRDCIVIGHSLGASMALEAVVHHGLKPWKVVLWDPPLTGEIEKTDAGALKALNRFRSEIRVVGGGKLLVEDGALMKYFKSLEPLALLRSIPEPKTRILAAIGSLIGHHGPLMEEAGIRAEWLSVLDLTGVDHFLNMVSLGSEDSWLLYRPGNMKLFLDSVIPWMEKP